MLCKSKYDEIAIPFFRYFKDGMAIGLIQKLIIERSEIMKKTYIIACCVLFIIFLTWFLFFRTQAIFQRKFHFSLPGTANIVNKSYSLFYDRLRLKVNFADSDYQYIFDEIQNFAENYFMFEADIEKIDENSSIKAFIAWWDKDDEKIIIAYDTNMQGRWGVKSRPVCVVITQNSQGQYHLHVHY